MRSGVGGPEIINQYIRKSGEQLVKIKISHPYLVEGGLLDDLALEPILEGTQIQTIEPVNNYLVKL